MKCEVALVLAVNFVLAATTNLPVPSKKVDGPLTVMDNVQITFRLFQLVTKVNKIDLVYFF